MLVPVTPVDTVCVDMMRVCAALCTRSTALQALVGSRFLSPGLPLIKLSVDHDRGLLYTLSSDGEIKV